MLLNVALSVEDCHCIVPEKLPMFNELVEPGHETEEGVAVAQAPNVVVLGVPVQEV